MFFGFLMLWGPLFWILMALECVVLLWCVEEEWPGRGFFSILAFGLLLFLFGDFNVFRYIYSNPLMVGKYAIYYLGIGVAWAFIKYYFHLAKVRRIYAEAKQKYIEKHPHVKDDFTKSHYDNVVDSLYPSDRSKVKNTKLLEKKSRIITWMSYWPLSVFWTLLSDFIKRIFEIIWDHLKGFFEAMRKHVLRDLLTDQQKSYK